MTISFFLVLVLQQGTRGDCVIGSPGVDYRNKTKVNVLISHFYTPLVFMDCAGTSDERNGWSDSVRKGCPKDRTGECFARCYLGAGLPRNLYPDGSMLIDKSKLSDPYFKVEATRAQYDIEVTDTFDDVNCGNDTVHVYPYYSSTTYDKTTPLVIGKITGGSRGCTINRNLTFTVTTAEKEKPDAAFTIKAYDQDGLSQDSIRTLFPVDDLLAETRVKYKELRDGQLRNRVGHYVIDAIDGPTDPHRAQFHISVTVNDPHCDFR